MNAEQEPTASLGDLQIKFLEYQIKASQVLMEGAPDLKDEIAQTVQWIIETRRRGGTIFALGNGGSLANANHFLAELIPLGYSTSSISDIELTALSNDFGQENALTKFLHPNMSARDLLLLFSTSGNSPNVVKAAEEALSIGGRVVGFTGKSGGRLAQLPLSSIIKVPSDETGIVENAHLSMVHFMAKALTQPQARIEIKKQVRLPRKLVFDLEGTLFDGEGFHQSAFAEVAEKLGVEFGAGEFHKFVGAGDFAISQEIARLLDNKVDDNVIRSWKNTIYMDMLDSHTLEPREGVTDYLDRARSIGGELVVASLTPPSNFATILSKTKLAPFFNFLLTDEKPEHKKPNPFIYEMAKKILNYREGPLIVHEDSPLGVKAAIAAG